MDPTDSVFRIKQDLKNSNKVQLPPIFTLWRVDGCIKLDEDKSLRGYKIRSGEAIAACQEKTWSLKVQQIGDAKESVVEVDPLASVSQLKIIISEQIVSSMEAFNLRNSSGVELDDDQPIGCEVSDGDSIFLCDANPIPM